MISVNIHEAKSNLSKLLVSVEKYRDVIRVCRNGQPVAQIVPMPETINPLVLHSELQGVNFNYDPLEPLAEDEWFIGE